MFEVYKLIEVDQSYSLLCCAFIFLLKKINKNNTSCYHFCIISSQFLCGIDATKLCKIALLIEVYFAVLCSLPWKNVVLN